MLTGRYRTVIFLWCSFAFHQSRHKRICIRPPYISHTCHRPATPAPPALLQRVPAMSTWVENCHWEIVHAPSQMLLPSPCICEQHPLAVLSSDLLPHRLSDPPVASADAKEVQRCSGAVLGEGPAAADPSYPQPQKQALDWTRAPRWDTSMHSLRASRHTDQQRDNRRTLSSSILKVDAPKLGTWLEESKLPALETVRLASALGLVHSDVIGLVHTREAATDMCNTNWPRRPSRIPLCLPITRVPANS